MTMIPRKARTHNPMKALAFGLTLALPGCAGAHLHDAGNYELARTAQADFKALNLSTSLDVERAHSDEMLKSELKATRDYLLAQRDEALLGLLDPPPDTKVPCPDDPNSPCNGTRRALNKSKINV